MKRYSYLPLVCTIFLVAFMLVPTAQAQYLLHRSVVGGGGGLIEGDNFQLFGTAGQATSGTITEGPYRLGSGFWEQEGTSASEGEEGGGGDASVIAVQIDHNHRPLDPVIVDIFVGDVAGGLPVNGLYGVGFKLHYEAERVSADEGSLMVGDFLDVGAPPLLFEQLDAVNGEIPISITRTDGEGISGEGIVARYSFTLPDGAIPGELTFSLSEILAIDAEGIPIPLTPSDGTTYIRGVWPGDTDNSCLVEGADLLPIGVAFGATGDPRDGSFDISWGAKPAHLGNWAIPTDPFADATGDGTVNQNDVLPIGLNYLQTRATPDCPTTVAASKGHATLASMTIDPAPVGTAMTLFVNADTPVTDLLGVAFKMNLPPDLLHVDDVRPGSLLDDGDLLAFDRFDPQTGLLDAAFTRKGTNPPANGTGSLIELDVKVVGSMSTPATLTLDDVKLSAADGTVTVNSALVALSATGTGTATSVDDDIAVPQTFTLHGAYPNPFNPSTTIAFDLPAHAEVTLHVYDILGRMVQRVQAGTLSAGANQQLRFEAGDLASGLYLYRLEARSEQGIDAQMGRFVLMK